MKYKINMMETIIKNTTIEVETDEDIDNILGATDKCTGSMFGYEDYICALKKRGVTI